MAVVILGYAALSGGIANSLSAELPKTNPKFNKPTVTCIHEIGHILHVISLGDDFFDDTTDWSNPTNAKEVSGYACANKKEFVAEVFAGLNCGLTFSKACMDEYSSLGGPDVWRKIDL